MGAGRIHDCSYIKMYLAVALKEYKKPGLLSYFYHFFRRKSQMERSKGNFNQRRHELFPGLWP